MTIDSSAIAHEETPYTIETTTTVISDALKRRARAKAVRLSAYTFRTSRQDEWDLGDPIRFRRDPDWDFADPF